jgi:hypothetical protein
MRGSPQIQGIAPGLPAFVGRRSCFVVFATRREGRACAEVCEGLVDVYEGSVDFYERSVDVYERSVDVYERSVEVYERFVDFYGRSVDFYERSVDFYRRSVEFYRSSVDFYEGLAEHDGSPGKFLSALPANRGRMRVPHYALRLPCPHRA